MSTSIIKKIRDVIMRKGGKLHGKAFGGGGGGFFGLLGLLTGNYANAADAGWGNGVGTGGYNFIDAGAGLSGGMVGALSETRRVHSAYFENAPHFSFGGMITDGGVPIIAHPGERILNRQQTKEWNSGGGGSPVTINLGDIHIDASGADPAVVARVQSTLAEFRKNQYADTVKIVQDASNRGLRLHA